MRKYTKEQMLETLRSLLSESDNVKSTIRSNEFGSWISSGVFEGWRTKILYSLQNSNLEALETINVISKLPPKEVESIESVEVQLITLIDLLENDYIQLSNGETKNKSQQELNLLFERFFKVARQLRNRHDNRDTIRINDEYDVQDLVHAILKLFFNDVRAEECTPSYAGGSSRIDFLIKSENIGIEIKKTRPNLRDKEIGEQLIIDKERYKSHHNCRTLICFVYDPDEQIVNPDGLANDLTEENEDMSVFVVISPKI